MKTDNRYKGTILTQLYTAVEKNPTMTFGEILLSFTRKDFLGNKHFFYATDEEIQTALEKFNKFVEEEDEPMEENDFIFWIEQATICKK